MGGGRERCKAHMQVYIEYLEVGQCDVGNCMSAVFVQHIENHLDELHKGLDHPPEVVCKICGKDIHTIHCEEAKDNQPENEQDVNAPDNTLKKEREKEEDPIHTPLEKKTTYHLYDPNKNTKTACGNKGSTTTDKKEVGCGNCKKTKLFKESK